MAFLYNKLTNRIILTLIVLWGTISFWFSITGSITVYTIILLSILSVVLIFLEKGSIFILIYSSFLVSFALYNFLYQYSLPYWLVMIIILSVFSYLFYFTEQKIGILGNKRLIYLVLFSLITLEIFFVLNYFIVSPLSKSLIISVISYVFVGFCYSVLAKHQSNNIKTYLLVSIGLIALVFASSIWGGDIWLFGVFSLY